MYKTSASAKNQYSGCGLYIRPTHPALSCPGYRHTPCVLFDRKLESKTSRNKPAASQSIREQKEVARKYLGFEKKTGTGSIVNWSGSFTARSENSFRSIFQKSLAPLIIQEAFFTGKPFDCGSRATVDPREATK